MSSHVKINPHSSPDPNSPMSNSARTVHGSPIIPHDKDEQPQSFNGCMGNNTPTKTDQSNPQKLSNLSTTLEPPFNNDTNRISSLQRAPPPNHNQIIPLHDVTGSCPHTPVSQFSGPIPHGPWKSLFPELSPTTKRPTPPQNQNKPLSPPSKPKLIFQVFNKFGPRLRNSKNSSSSSVTLGSSSESSPLFLPVFENNIPNQTQLAQLEKRKKKQEKEKKRLKLIAAMDQYMGSEDQPVHSLGSIKVDDIIEMADSLGLTFSGPKSELRKRIQSILVGHQDQEWCNHQQFFQVSSHINFLL